MISNKNKSIKKTDSENQGVNEMNEKSSQVGTNQ